MSPKTVLVTGISGFVGSHVAKAFLDRDWIVVGTVRSAKKGDDLFRQPAFAKAAEEKRIRYVVVEDLVSSDIRPAMEGVDALAHTASPFHFDGTKFADYAEPAIKGTSNVLEAAKEFSQIKAVVVTSSFVAIVNREPPTKQAHRVYTEEDWLPIGYEEAEAQTNPGVWYCASKKFAEKKAWEIKESGASWSMATICPPMIFGPVIHTTDLNGLNESSGQLYRLLSGQTKQGEIPETVFPACSDVRDVAEAHVEAIIQQSTGRFLISSSEYDNQRVVDFIRERFPKASGRAPIGNPGKHYLREEIYRLDPKKAVSTFGLKIKTFDQVFGDTIEQYLDIEKASVAV